jgi:hypothetical protein
MIWFQVLKEQKKKHWHISCKPVFLKSHFKKGQIIQFGCFVLFIYQSKLVSLSDFFQKLIQLALTSMSL